MQVERTQRVRFDHRGAGWALEGRHASLACAKCHATEYRTDPAARINNEEVFGPVASTIRVKTYEEALAICNSGDFGLSAGICTTSLKYARHFQKAVRAGMVMVNLPTAGVDYHVPFGGTRKSSYGAREQGFAAVEFYTQTKTHYVFG